MWNYQTRKAAVAFGSLFALHFLTAQEVQSQNDTSLFKSAVYIVTDAQLVGTTQHKQFYSTGVIITPEGHVLTSAHSSMPDLFDTNWTNATTHGVIGSKTGNSIPLDRIGAIGVDRDADVAILKFREGVGINFEPAIVPESLEVQRDASITVIGFPLNQEASILHGRISSLFGENDTWTTDAKVQEGSSGSPVFNDLGQLIGIITGGFQTLGEPMPLGLNKIVPIRKARSLASGLDWQFYRETAKVSPVGSQKDFMAGTCEGTIAWHRDDGEYWVFPLSGEDYVLERKDMSLDVCVCGKTRDARRRSLVFTINHSTRQNCKSVDNFCSLPVTSKTFYGVQIVPIVKQGKAGDVATQVWLQKSNVLFARTSSGAFYTPVDHGMPNAQTAPGFTPKDFNDAIKSARVYPFTHEITSCNKRLSVDECLDLAAMKTFSRELDLTRPWHGFPRGDGKSRSTLLTGGKEIWRVPDDWIDAGKKQVLNWLLRYAGTRDTKSANPVDFKFCVFPQWKEFYLRTFSPERCVTPQLIHVYIKD